MKKIYRLSIGLFFITFLFLELPIRSNENRPEQMKYLAQMLRGTWTGSIEGTQGEHSLEMWGRWILGGHFLELEIVTREKSRMVCAEIFIFGWKASENVYSCHYFNSSGENRSSSWSMKEKFSLVQLSRPTHSIKQGAHEGQLYFHYNGKNMILQLKSR